MIFNLESLQSGLEPTLTFGMREGLGRNIEQLNNCAYPGAEN